ncbi:hypothetical protein ONS95_012693 [Cadophora gregata]|uniref:uncharacterized protein n=1 Tax=Cadophora gregata TaxID=51156 RepID=UPI0026DB2901|nr:uncharacterized protein ONS95_012693 [Cadophora gregata]KAK0118404.1 hypothetical protein ONS95_012693 [Cadophora gregata]KAK0123474.1 hypothetical protein ONS96_010457 [Cadophora gregata f. sp. sojae]
MSEQTDTTPVSQLNNTPDRTQTEGQTIETPQTETQRTVHIASEPRYGAELNSTVETAQNKEESSTAPVVDIISQGDADTSTAHTSTSTATQPLHPLQPLQPLQSQQSIPDGEVIEPPPIYPPSQSSTGDIAPEPTTITFDHLMEVRCPFSPERITNMIGWNIGHIYPSTEEERSQVSGYLLDIFKQMKSLEMLEFNFSKFHEVIPIATICRTGTTLKRLVATDSDRNGNDPISLNDVKELLEYCPLNTIAIVR